MNGWVTSWNGNSSSAWVEASLEQSISQNIRAAILTRIGERPLQRDFGSRLYDFFFRVLDSALIAELESHLVSVISKCEPRVAVREILVGKKKVEQSEIQLSVRYDVLETQHPGELRLTVRP